MRSSRSFTSRSPAILLAFLAAWLLATLGWRPLLLPDEGRYADVARAMTLAPDGWLVPRLDGLPFFHKPPLFYWLDVAAMRLAGVHAWSARFGSAVGAWLMGAALLMAMRRWHGARAGAIGLGVLATTPLYFVAGQYANHDMLVGGLITVAVLAVARAVEAPPRVELRWLVAGWVACALALLAKGLIGVVLPALVVGPWLLVQGRRRQLLGLLHPAGLAAFAVIGLPWFVAMQQRYPGFYDYFVLEQHFRRFAASDFNNVHGAWFYLVLLPLATLPWSGWAPAMLREAWRERRGLLGDPTRLLYLWWTVAIVGFFTLPSSKLIGYVLPGLAPWCALLALAITRQPARRIARVGGVTAAALVALVAVVAHLAPNSNRDLALELKRRFAPGDRVVVLDRYPYDLPFYAGLTEPLRIAADWADPSIALHDNWKKEVADAARFDPARAADVLIAPAEVLGSTHCPAEAVWVVVPRDAPPATVAAVASAASPAGRVAANRSYALWRFDGRAVCR